MKWLVTVALQNGSDATVEVVATNKSDAEYRAAFKVETERKSLTSHVVACRKIG